MPEPESELELNCQFSSVSSVLNCGSGLNFGNPSDVRWDHAGSRCTTSQSPNGSCIIFISTSSSSSLQRHTSASKSRPPNTSLSSVAPRPAIHVHTHPRPPPPPPAYVPTPSVPATPPPPPPAAAAAAPAAPAPVDIHTYPTPDLLKLLASLFTQIAATNDALSPVPSPTATSPYPTIHPNTHTALWPSLTTASRVALTTPAATLTFHARNVPTISLEAYLLHIL
ncbi:hypothetical protein H0H92_013609, partial [Tricholoma furcatifolium]